MLLRKLDFEQRQIRKRVDSHHRGSYVGSVMENDQDLGGPVHDMGIREDQALLV